MTKIYSFDPFAPEEGPLHHERMARLRAECPVAHLDSGMVVLSRFHDVRQILSSPDMSNQNAARAPGVDVPPEDRLFFFEYDPPEHLPLRRSVRVLLSRERANRTTGQVRSLILELLGPIFSAGSADFAKEFTAPLAGRVMMRLCGFPESDAALWRSWVRDWISSGFSFANQNENGTGFVECYPQVLEYLDRHLDERAALIAQNPPAGEIPDDALTCVVTARIDGEPLSRTWQRMIVGSFPPAGGNTMGNFVNNSLHTLARDPGLFERIRADRKLIPYFVEESLRRDTPSMFISRVCKTAHEVEGERIEAGQKVLLGLASANRDEAAYPDAGRFDVDRTGPAHVAFGWGTHTCVGAHIVRHLGVTLLETLLDMVQTIEVEPGTTPVRYMSPQGNGLDELRLKITAVA